MREMITVSTWSMDEKVFNDFLIGKQKWIVSVCSEGVYLIGLKSLVYYMSTFSSLPLVSICFFPSL